MACRKKAKEGKKIKEITVKDFVENGLTTILRKYNLYALLKMVKPDLKPWELNRVPNEYWNNPKNVKEAVEWLVNEMVKKGKKIEDISAQDFKDAGLGGLIQYVELYELIRIVKPDLKPWQLNQVPPGYWHNPENVKEAVEWLVEKKAKEGKRIEEISVQDFIDAGLSTLFNKHKKAELLRMVKPDYEHDDDKTRDKP